MISGVENKVEVAAAKILWDFNLGTQNPQKGADFIVTLGSTNTGVAERGAELYHQGYAPMIVCAGGRTNLTSHWDFSEAETFARVLQSNSVPRSDILIEDQSTNTGDNIRLTRNLLKGLGYEPRLINFVGLSYMGLRIMATARKQWPELGKEGIGVTSPQVPFESYGLPFERLAKLLVIQTRKLPEYSKLGFQIPVDVPQEVLDACDYLESLENNQS